MKTTEITDENRNEKEDYDLMKLSTLGFIIMMILTLLYTG